MNNLPTIIHVITSSIFTMQKEEFRLNKHSMMEDGGKENILFLAGDPEEI